MSTWRVDNNGTGETIDIYEGDRLVTEMHSIRGALDLVAALNAAAAREAALRAALVETKANAEQYLAEGAESQVAQDVATRMIEIVDATLAPATPAHQGEGTERQ